MESKVKYLYLYNIEQVSFYIRNNVYPVDTGINPNTNKVWNKFIKSDTTEVYNEWMNRKH